MNTNLWHNILNLLIAILAAATAFFVATGCSVLVETGALDCAQSWLPPGWTAIATSLMALAKIAINILRDGLAGLAKRQPPVQ